MRLRLWGAGARSALIFLALVILGAQPALASPEMTPATPKGRSSLNVKISGLPVGMPAAVVVTGPTGLTRNLTESTVLRGLVPGKYRIRAGSFDTSVGKATASRGVQELVLKARSSGKVEVRYDIATSVVHSDQSKQTDDSGFASFLLPKVSSGMLDLRAEWDTTIAADDLNYEVVSESGVRACIEDRPPKDDNFLIERDGVQFPTTKLQLSCQFTEPGAHTLNITAPGVRDIRLSATEPQIVSPRVDGGAANTFVQLGQGLAIRIPANAPQDVDVGLTTIEDPQRRPYGPTMGVTQTAPSGRTLNGALNEVFVFCDFAPSIERDCSIPLHFRTAEHGEIVLRYNCSLNCTREDYQLVGKAPEYFPISTYLSSPILLPELVPGGRAVTIRTPQRPGQSLLGPGLTTTAHSVAVNMTQAHDDLDLWVASYPYGEAVEALGNPFGAWMGLGARPRQGSLGMTGVDLSMWFPWTGGVTKEQPTRVRILPRAVDVSITLPTVTRGSPLSLGVPTPVPLDVPGAVQLLPIPPLPNGGTISVAVPKTCDEVRIAIEASEPSGGFAAISMFGLGSAEPGKTTTTKEFRSSSDAGLTLILIPGGGAVCTPTVTVTSP